MQRTEAENLFNFDIEPFMWVFKNNWQSELKKNCITFCVARNDLLCSVKYFSQYLILIISCPINTWKGRLLPDSGAYKESFVNYYKDYNDLTDRYF